MRDVMLVVTCVTKYQGCWGRLESGNGDAELVACKEAAYIDLSVIGILLAVIAIARHEVPVLAEIMIKTGDGEVAPERDRNVPLEADLVVLPSQAVAGDGRCKLDRYRLARRCPRVASRLG